MDDLISSILELKKLLGPEGEYSITRSNGESMNLPEVIMIGDVLEKIDIALENCRTDNEETK